MCNISVNNPLYSNPITPENEMIYKLPEKFENSEENSLYQGIESQSDMWMKMACEEAVESVKNGGGPFGAVILQIDTETNRIIRYWRNQNQVTQTNDPTAHAEIMTIRSACKSLGVFNLGEVKKSDTLLKQPGESSYCVIYSSTEPCPMCYSAIHWSRIPILIFAANRFDGGVAGFSDEEIYMELEAHYSKRKIKVCKCNTDNSADAFDLWKSCDNVEY